jgi:predicted MFS family arabinose efflux permease
VLWIATLISNTGTWMHDLGAGWLMTTLAPSPAMVALVQAASTLPVFLFSLPAGALADIVDRRRLLIFIQAAMAVLAALVGIVVLRGEMTAALLLAFTFALGVCAAATSPAWQAVVPKIVPKEHFAAAVALNAVSINLSRAVGPALGGIIIASFGLAWPFLVNAVSFLAVIGALIWWRSEPAPPRQGPQEGFVRAMGAGLRHVMSSPPLRATLLRAVSFFSFASAYWALLPLIARVRLDGSSKLYGVLVGCIGAGAVCGAQLLPRIRSRIGPDRVLVASTLGTVIAMTVFALVRNPVAASFACLLAGATWISALSTLTVSAQLLLPDWVRARGLAVYNTIFYGSLALGSICWGQLAEYFGISGSLLVASGGALLAMASTWRFGLRG